MASIYLHIPFCRRLCGYCDFFKSVHTARLDEVVEAMMGELESERDFLTTHRLSTIYFGGGTPSLLSLEQVGYFMNRIDHLYDVSGVKEVTFEANPDDLSLEYLRGLRSVGINRLSIGVQSFDDGELRFMNRRHDSARALRAISDARSVGFDNIAIDLIFGVPDYGESVLRRSLDIALDLDVEHIAAYHLTIEDGTPFARRVSKGDFHPVDESVSEQEYSIVREMLVGGGYDHYEISNYAKRGFRSQHNSSYWRGEEYLGIGAGAHSFSGNRRRWALSSIDSYLSGDRYEGEVLSVMQRRNEVVMTSLRCAEGIDLDLFESMFGCQQRELLLRDAQKSLDFGDLLVDSGSLRIPPNCFLRSDSVIERLFFQEY